MGQAIMVDLLEDEFAPVNAACTKLKKHNIPHAVGDENRYSGSHIPLFTILVPISREIEARKILGLIEEDKRQ